MLRYTRVAALAMLLVSSATSKAQAPARVDLAANLLAERSLQANTAANFWAEGGSLELGIDAFHGFGMAAHVSGVHTSSVGSGNVPLSLVTATFGPRYRWASGHRLSPYAEALLGEANGFKSLFPSATGADSSASSLALQLGGSLDLSLSRRFAVRAFEASWLRTQLPNGANNRQNSLRLGAGLVVRFGG